MSRSKNSRHPANSSSRASCPPPSPGEATPIRQPAAHRHTPAPPDRERTGPALRPACPPRPPRGLPRRSPAVAAPSPPAPRTPPRPVRQAPPAVPPYVPGQAVKVLAQLPAQPRLPHPGRARHQRHPRHPAFRRRMEQFPDRAQLRVPPDQRRLQPVHPLRPAHPGQHPDRPPQRARLRLALQRMLPGIGEPDRAARQPLRRPISQHPTRVGRRLHPRRGVHPVPGDHPLPRRAQRDRHLAGHHPRPRRQPSQSRLRAQLGSPRLPGPTPRALPAPRPPRSRLGCPTPPSPYRR